MLDCEHRRPHQDPHVFGCRVKGVCTLDECSICRDRPGVAALDVSVDLLPKHTPIGTDYHRSGWPLAYRALQSLQSPHADNVPRSDPPLLLDDFVEQTWIYSSRQQPIDRPWVGIFHHPPHPPRWSSLSDRLDALPELAAFRASTSQLRMAICLSDYLADWISQHWQVPTAVVTHPTGFGAPEFDLEAWQSAPRVTQVGWYLRNTRLIHEIDTPISRTRLLPRKAPQQVHDQDCQAAFAARTEFPGVAELPYIDNHGYDFLLSRSVVVMELLDASANNVTLECIARATPVIVNRHPAAVEYLGADYPLFYDDWREIAALLSSDRVQAAHEYLCRLAVDRFRVAHFRNEIADVLRGLT